jgi:hypothetical protein
MVLADAPADPVKTPAMRMTIQILKTSRRGFEGMSWRNSTGSACVPRGKRRKKRAHSRSPHCKKSLSQGGDHARSER